MHVYSTACCKDKSDEEGAIPALERYREKYIAEIYQLSLKHQKPFVILSGKFGILQADDLIPFYDMTLTVNRIPLLLPQITAYLQNNSISRMTFFSKKIEIFPGWRPYVSAMEQACRQSNTLFNVAQIGSPYAV